MKRRLYQLAIIIISLLVIQGLSRSLIELRTQKNRLADIKKDLGQLEKKELELKKQLEYYQSDEYAEKVARDKLLMGKEGETVIILPKDYSAGSVPDGLFLPPETGEPDLPNWKKWLKLFGF